MPEPVLLRNSRDTYVSSVNPTSRLHRRPRLWLKSGTHYAYIYFARPFPLGVNILSAKLRVYNASTWSGANTISVRRINETWGIRTTWNVRPGVWGVVQTLTKTGATDGTEWSLDVEPEMQAVADGAKWYGFRLEVDSSTARALYSSHGRYQYRPTLEVEWTDAPEAPEDLFPGGGRAVSVSHPVLRCDFTDDAGDTEIQSIHVQLATSEANSKAGVTVFDSGAVAVSEPELDLATTAYTGMTADTTRWWRVRVQDGAGLWSQWSEPESFKRTTMGTLTITNPAAAPNDFVSEPTPPITWTFTGRTQRAYQVIIINPDNGKWLYDSGKITSTDTSVSIPRRILRVEDKVYRLRIKIWDTVDREKTPGDPPFLAQNRDFRFELDPTTNPVTNLTATRHVKGYPWMTLNWDRSTMPDSFSIMRDGRIIDDNLEPADLLVSGTSYQYVDKTASPRVDHTWRIVAVVNGKGSKNNPGVTDQVRAVTTCLSRPNDTDAVLLFNPDNDIEHADTSELHERVGDAPPVLILQSLGGLVGSCEGRLADYAGTTAQTFLSRLEELREDTGRRMSLTYADISIDAIVYNITWVPVPFTEHVEYDVSFDFYQVDEW